MKLSLLPSVSLASPARKTALGRFRGRGEPQSRCSCGAGEPQSRCRHGAGEPQSRKQSSIRMMSASRLSFHKPSRTQARVHSRELCHDSKVRSRFYF